MLTCVICWLILVPRPLTRTFDHLPFVMASAPKRAGWGNFTIEEVQEMFGFEDDAEGTSGGEESNLDQQPENPSKNSR